MRSCRSLALTLALFGCDRGPHDGTMQLPLVGAPTPSVPAPDGAPVAINPQSPVLYPEPLRAQRIEGTVLLRLFADSTGALVPESTRVAESSGFPALDSAALAGAPELRFAPAVREGRPVAAAFLQPVQFRQSRRRR
ncbi:MAG TPA: energy transducer TonB [Gemmatimonadales bacterium]|nr:energy transducer TonB [Gemmatimonadales bacterium]